MLKYIAIAIAVTCIFAAGVYIDGQSFVPPVHTKPQSGPTMIFAAGRIEGASEEVELRPQLSGRIVQLAVSDGQSVERGDLLLQLDNAQYRHEVALAAAELAQYEAALTKLLNGARQQEREEADALYRSQLADLERAQLSWKRVQQLRADRAISQQEADDQRTLLDAMQAKVEAAKARVDLLNAPARDDEIEMARAQIAAAKAKQDLAEMQLERTSLCAPADGQVLLVNVREQELTGPESVTPSLIFADTSRFRVRAFVEELDAPRVRVGMVATITADGMPDKVFTGRVTKLSPRMGRKRLFTDDPAEQYDVKTREVWIDIDTNDHLVVGLRVDVTIDPTTASVSDSPASSDK